VQTSPYSPATRQAPVALVTGAQGTIGHYVALRLTRQGYTVLGLGHANAHPLAIPVGTHLTLIEGDVTLATLRALPLLPSVIVHCAGGSAVGAAIANPHLDFMRTVASTADILEFIRTECPSAKLVYPSSAAVYGSTDRLPMRTTDPVQPTSTYGTHKLLAEQLVQDRARHCGIHAVIVRLFSVYGEGFRKQLLWDACQKIAAGRVEFFGTGDESRDWLHVSDTAELIHYAIAHASTACPVANGASGHRTTVRDILDTLIRELSPDASPRFCGTIRPGDPLHFHADIQVALDWGWHPTVPWPEGIRRYAAWFRKESGLPPAGN
jgi:UDP-glucose 4-epimerase